jgi:6-phosphofructokinase 1
MAIPKTMDNDVFGTDYCIGFSTAVTRSVELITNLRTAVGSHERIGVVELFGRNSGETSLISAYCAQVDRAIISEVPFDIHKLADLLLKDKASNPSNYAIMTISEGATMIGGEIVERGEEDAYGHKKLGGIGNITAQMIKEITGQNIIYQQLAYLMRSGAPDALDRIVAANYGSMAVDLATRGITGRMVALREGRYTHVAADYTTRGVKRVDVDEFYDIEMYRPKVSHVQGKPMFLY